MTLTLLGVLIAFAAQELDRKAEVSRADLAALAVAAAVAAAGVLSWLKRSFPAPVLRTTNLEMARQTLAEQVEQQWKTESRLRVLDDPEPMPIAWRLTGNAAVMSQPHLITAGDPPFSARADDIADLTRQFRALKRRRLIITGDGNARSLGFEVSIQVPRPSRQAILKSRHSAVFPGDQVGRLGGFGKHWEKRSEIFVCPDALHMSSKILHRALPEYLRRLFGRELPATILLDLFSVGRGMGHWVSVIYLIIQGGSAAHKQCVVSINPELDVLQSVVQDRVHPL
ncbi:hypothetical protein ACFWYW_41265 [Nonomuraea sp. NPDC059023]|uniref:hypothetical protein n=1 Tax=unclassified Nonomuraea TaxID=2593643 RepID=UPI0036856775